MTLGLWRRYMRGVMAADFSSAGCSRIYSHQLLASASVLWHCGLGDRKHIWPVTSCAAAKLERSPMGTLPSSNVSSRSSSSRSNNSNGKATSCVPHAIVTASELSAAVVCGVHGITYW